LPIAALDSAPLRERFRKRGIELIGPYLKDNKRRHEGGRELRRYRRRWIGERTNPWLGLFRRLLVRHEHLLSTYQMRTETTLISGVCFIKAGRPEKKLLTVKKGAKLNEYRPNTSRD
jgi:hypothetical protein